ncbi:MAG: PEGA domain-containing protein [Polyangiaceae bacterium]|nr:PEGA domain-containing protein [Polyangiaceae bacterium]
MARGLGMNAKRVPHCVGMLLCMIALAAPGVGQTDDAKARARAHFDRGLRAFDRSDDAGALAEFQAAYELIPNPVVLHSIGLVYAALGRPVQAVDALERSLAASPKLSAEQLARARATLDAERAKIGTIHVVTNVAASVEIDGRSVGRSPGQRSVPVPSGLRVVGAVAPGHLPARKEVSVAGGQSVTVQFELEPSERAHATVQLRVDTLDADVRVDGVRLGKSPLTESLTLAAGRRRVEVTRAGYQPFRRAVELAPGSTSRLDVRLEPDAAAVARTGGTLALELDDALAVVFIDGVARGGRGSFPLAAGRHRLRVERGEFLPIDREVNVAPGRTTTLSLSLSPTPEKRARYVDAATERRTLSLITAGSGAAVAVVGGTFWVLNQGKKSDNQLDIDRQLGRCAELPAASPERVACAREAEPLLDRKDELGRADWIFGAVTGVGLLATGTGVALWLTGDDPARYDPRPESDVFARLRVDSDVTSRDLRLRLSGSF